MILPSKHALSDRTLVVLGGRLLAMLAEPTDLGSLWRRARDEGVVTSFERYYSALLFLRVIGTISIADGRLYRHTPS